MTSNRPYLLRALYEWILDNELTPLILVAANQPGVVVPQQHIKDGQIILNIGPSAVRDLTISNDLVHFHARFSGTPMNVRVPPNAVLGIYARENGHGMLFPEEAMPDTELTEDMEQTAEKAPETEKKRSHLKVVK